MDAATLVLALFCFVSGTGLQAPPAAGPGTQAAVSERAAEPAPVILPAAAPEPEVTLPPAGDTSPAAEFSLRGASAAVVYMGPDTEISQYIRDEGAAAQLAEAFSGLTPLSAERIPKTGSPTVTVHLDLAGERHAYTMQAPGRDGVLYCKDTLVDDLFSTTGWLVVPDAGLYGRLVEFCFTNPIPQ